MSKWLLASVFCLPLAIQTPAPYLSSEFRENKIKDSLGQSQGLDRSYFENFDVWHLKKYFHKTTPSIFIRISQFLFNVLWISPQNVIAENVNYDILHILST